MDELEALRQRRMQELQQQQAAAAAQGGSNPGAPGTGAGPSQEELEAQAAQQEALLEQALQQILEPEARERLTRVRLSRPELAASVSQQLVALAQSGRLARRLGDQDLRNLLAQLTPKDRDISIRRK
ncbi:MAG: DNA-binding protein [Thermoplasmatota archaeon]